MTVYHKDQRYSKCGSWIGIIEKLLEMQILRPHPYTYCIKFSGGRAYKSTFTSAPQVIYCQEFS